MAGYLDTRQMIIDTLMGRPEGTQIQPEDHQAYALNLLNYIRSVELSSGSTLTGIAEADTVPIEPYDSRVAYITSVPQNTVRTFTYFKKENNEPITITTTDSSAFVILLWNTQYWEYQSLPVTVFENDSFVGYFECASLSTDTNKTISSEINQLTTDMRILVKMNNINTQDNATLQIGLTESKPLFYNGSRASSTNSWAQGEVLDVYYDGTKYIATYGCAQFSTGEKVGDVGIVNIPGTNLDSVMSQKGATDLVSEYNVSTNNNNAEYTFAQAVALVPASLQKGGLTIKYIDSITHEYAIKRLMSPTWNTTESNWQGIDAEPTAESDNLVKSQGICFSEALQHLKVFKYSIQTNTWYGDSNKHLVIPVNSGESLQWDSSGTTVLYCAFLTEYDHIPQLNETPNFVTGYEGRQSIYSTGGTIPVGCKYFIINNPQNYTSIKINGKEILNGYIPILFEKVKTEYLEDNCVTTDKITNSSVTTNKIADHSVTSDKIADGVLPTEITLGTTIVSKNIANTANVKNGLLNQDGRFIGQLPGSGYMVEVLDVIPGQVITFGGNDLGRGEWCTFFSDTPTPSAATQPIVSFVGVTQNEYIYGKTVTVPEGAKYLYFMLQFKGSPTNANVVIQANYGDSLLEYDEYQEAIDKINGIPIATKDIPEDIEERINTLEDKVETLEDAIDEQPNNLIADLPVSDGTDISVGYAYIDSNTGVVKIKMS